ncbi:MAG: MarR family transcriptional regulator [Thermoleophilia bacterium]|nr:MarR family transcriptional regulator [Thermoleophilia bacterium]
MTEYLPLSGADPRPAPPSPDGASDFKLDESIGFLIYRAQLLMKKELARQFRPHDITPEQWAVLNRLWECDGQTQRQLADRTFKDQPTMARICRRLEEKGLVVRRPCPDDGRASLVNLSAEARTLIPELIPRAVRTLQKALAGIDPVEAAIARKVMGRVFENLG